MTRLTTTFHRLTTAVLAALVLTLAACSGNDDSNPMGNVEPEPLPMDMVTVTFNTLTAYLDCDGPDNPGDFHYSINVDTIDANGDWHAASNFGERSATLSNGVTRVSPFGVTITQVRDRYQRFRVRIKLREDDGANDDFSRSATYSHRFIPETGAWAGNWDQSTRQGHESYELKLRDRQTNWIGNVTEEGCHVKMTYTVTAREMQN